jgi:predicted nucleic acid-binding protein
MRRVFADSLYWIALSHQRDQWHAAALKASHALQIAEIVTTQEMLGELLTAFRHTPLLRSIAARRVHQITADPRVIVLPQSNHSFQAGFALYQSRPDKHYSLTDCISMESMRQEGITDILTHDNHFTQEGFTALL